MSSPGNGDAANLAGALLKDTWRVDHFVAQGGFGVVYRGHHVRTHRPVAVKALKLPPSVSPELRVSFVDGFEREAQILARLQHEAIVEVLDLSEAPDADGVMWMVLEWVEGARFDHVLAERRAQGSPWTPAQCLDLLRPVLQALAEAHERGVVHRDLKPANLMISPGRGGTEVARLLDFGIAKLIDPSVDAAPSGETHTRSDLLAFSLLYAAPEQVAQKRTGPWTDVHAMGLILTEMICGRCPYGDRQTDKAHVMRRALDEARPTPAALGASVGAWEPVLARALAHAPGERYPNAKELLRALEAALPNATGVGGVAETTSWKAGPSVPPPVESTAVRTAPARLRSRFAVALGGVALGVVLVGAWAIRERAVAPARPVRGGEGAAVRASSRGDGGAAARTEETPAVVAPAVAEGQAVGVVRDGGGVTDAADARARPGRTHGPRRGEAASRPSTEIAPPGGL